MPTSMDARVLPPPTVSQSQSVISFYSVNSADNDVINKPIKLTTFQLRYHESGRSAEVNPFIGQWNMIDL
ncbi:hypothetical protein Tco_1578718, partial [Tanacetum coccineum]